MLSHDERHSLKFTILTNYNIISIMKKFLISALTAICALGVSAQTFWDSDAPEQKVTFGVRAGLDIAKLRAKDDDSKSRTSFLAGVSADFNLVKSFSINSGLFYTGKGAKDFSADFIELPIYASYRLNFAEESQLQINVGPYLDFGVTGDAFKDDADCKRFQMGLGLGAGYTFHKIYLGLQYQWGLTEVVKDSKAHWDCLSIAVGYNF